MKNVIRHTKRIIGTHCGTSGVVVITRRGDTVKNWFMNMTNSEGDGGSAG